jgi:DNA-binding transcriptional regulator YiaG
MAPLQEPDILAMYRIALNNYRYEGYITWKDSALAWLGKELSGFSYRMPDESTTIEPKNKPFPWHCPRCRRKEVRPVVIGYRTEVSHDGQLYTVEVPQLTIPRCANCGELVFGNQASEQIEQALRAQLHLLSPAQIRANREQLGLSRKELAERLRVSEELVEQWEEGLMIPSGLADRALRGCFAVPAYRKALADMSQDPNLGEVVVS